MRSTPYALNGPKSRTPLPIPGLRTQGRTRRAGANGPETRKNRHVDSPAPLSQYLACLVSPKTNSPPPTQRPVRVGAQKAIFCQ